MFPPSLPRTLRARAVSSGAPVMQRTCGWLSHHPNGSDVPSGKMTRDANPARRPRAVYRETTPFPARHGAFDLCTIFWPCAGARMCSCVRRPLRRVDVARAFRGEGHGGYQNATILPQCAIRRDWVQNVEKSESRLRANTNFWYNFDGFRLHRLSMIWTCFFLNFIQVEFIGKELPIFFFLKNLTMSLDYLTK